jgi:hypothetical protein
MVASNFTQLRHSIVPLDLPSLVAWCLYSFFQLSLQVVSLGAHRFYLLTELLPLLGAHHPFQYFLLRIIPQAKIEIISSPPSAEGSCREPSPL